MKKYGNLSLLFGILGMIFCWFIFGIVFSVFGFIFSAKGLKSEAKRPGKIVAGLILSILSLILAIVMIAGLAAAGGSSAKAEGSTPQLSAEVEQQSGENPGGEKEDPAEKAGTDEAGTDEAGTDEAGEVQLSAEEYKEQCQEYDYKDVLRNPQNYVGQKIKVTVKVSSVHTESFGMPKYYFGYTNDDLDLWLGDRYGIFEYRLEDDFKILEDDIIAVYGEISDPRQTESPILNAEELFCIDMKYADLIEE